MEMSDEYPRRLKYMIHNTMIVLLYKYIIKYVVFDYLPDEDKSPC